MTVIDSGHSAYHLAVNKLKCTSCTWKPFSFVFRWLTFRSKISNGQNPSRNCLNSSLKHPAHFRTKCDILSYLRCLVIIIYLEPSNNMNDYSLEVCHIPILTCELLIYVFDMTSLHFSNSCDLHIKEFENNSITMLPCICHSLGHLKPAHSMTLFNIHALCELGAEKQMKMNINLKHVIKPK